MGAHIIEHSEDLDLEFFDAIPRENRPAGAMHAGADVLQGKEGILRRHSGSEGQERGEQKTKHLIILPVAAEEKFGGGPRQDLARYQKFDRKGAMRYDVNAGWSSLVARWAHNPKVEGSNPSPATKTPSPVRLTKPKT